MAYPVICLFSTSDDRSTTDVYRWIRHEDREAAVLRVNSDQRERIQSLAVTAETVSAEVDGQLVDFSRVTAVWYRKGNNWLCNLFSPIDMPSRPALQLHLRRKLQLEESRLSEFVHEWIERRSHHLGSARAVNLNKLLVLDAARSCGFTVPTFLISTSSQALHAFADAGGDAITKAISDGVYFFDHDDSSLGYFSFTEEVGVESMVARSTTLAPSLLQRRVAKQFDLRVFHLDGRCHAMAIFSQSADRTKVDFRRYNDQHPNRTVPYDLPTEVENRLCELFSTLNLNTGSADLIVDDAGDYVFLEINPVGQFGMVSEPCNYYLEREVARWLLDGESHAGTTPSR